MGFGSQNKTKAVIAGELASIIAHKVKKSGDRIGGMVYTGDNYDLITPKRDSRNIIYFLQKIVGANQSIYEFKEFDFEKTLAEVIAKLNNIITHDYLVIIISDFYRNSKPVIQYLSQLSAHNDLILIKVYDKMEEQLPSEKLVISNRTHQINIDGKNKKLIKEISSGFDSDLKKFKSELEKYEITLIKINTSDPVIDQLMEVLGN
jgi:uncharacterized protein (DUF58 family)